MEALAALGLASNVIQFVQFVSELMSTGSEIAKSTHGASQRTIELETVYDSLYELSSRLHASCDAPQLPQALVGRTGLIGSEKEVQSHILFLGKLSAGCRNLCQQLLETVQELQVKGHSHRQFKSFIAALKTIWGSQKICRLEENIRLYQATITMHFFPLLSHQQSDMLKVLNELREESNKMKLDQVTRLDDLTLRLQKIKDTISSCFKEAEEDLAMNNDEVPSDAPKTGELSKTSFGYRSRVIKLNSDDIKGLEEGVSELGLAKQDLAIIEKQQAFMSSLHFTSRLLRHEEIPVAHKRTFQWVLNSPGESWQNRDREHASLPTWLSQGSKIFWISGKAGSGKSTLMKLIADHNETRRLLEKWASPKKLVVATHYFWTSGTPMQKSQLGLLQTLLYDVFRTCPEQISQICPARWAKTLHEDSTRHEQWFINELLEALRALARSSTLAMKYCMFIDGVDEYDGDHFELCQVFKELSASLHFKFCISSRPWNVFEDAFGLDPSQKLYIHTLTRQDISVYARDRLMEHHRWNETYFSKDQMESVIESITERAQGVFLWVFLVTRSLRNGLANGDTMLDLQRRLESLPSDLEPIFKHMMDVVEPFYHENMARTLQTAVNAKEPLHLEHYHTLEYGYEDTDYAIHRPTVSETADKFEGSLDQCRRRINARCGGLLEIKSNRVVFLHRTVRDFLLTREIHGYLCERSGPDFMVHLSILKCFLFIYRCWMNSGSTISAAEGKKFWRKGLQYANNAMLESEEATLLHLGVVEDIYMSSKAQFESRPCVMTNDYVFRSEIIQAGVDRYVAVKLKEDPNFFNSGVTWPLYDAIDGDWSDGHINIFVSLLQSGQDPNGKSDLYVYSRNTSPWCCFVQKACTPLDPQNFTKAVENSLFSVFLKHGASRSARLWCGIPPSTKEAFPCTHFIDAIFIHKYSHRFSNQCIGALHDFLDENSEVIILELNEILDALRVQFRKISQGTDPIRLRFFAQITEKIILKGIRAGVKMDTLVPYLNALFPWESVLIDLIQNSDEARFRYPSVLGSLKRRQNSPTPGPPGKQAK